MFEANMFVMCGFLKCHVVWNDQHNQIMHKFPTLVPYMQIEIYYFQTIHTSVCLILLA